MRQIQKSIIHSFLILLVVFCIPSCQREEVNTPGGSTENDGSGGTEDDGRCIDADGNVYQTVVIGNQEWMAENLRSTHYADGSPITLSNLFSETTPYRYCPAHDEQYVPTYGYLYNWPAVMHGADGSNNNPSGVQGICPNGWHLPSDAEWDEMESTLTDENVHYTYNTIETGCVGDHAGKLAGEDWKTSNLEGAPGNINDPKHNSSGFSALPAGWRNGAYDDEEDVYKYLGFGRTACFWSSTRFDRSMSSIMQFHFAISRSLDYNVTCVHRSPDNKQSAYSVRCVKDR
jgi:uncharacterized protein (TIGR02145 family)